MGIFTAGQFDVESDVASEVFNNPPNGTSRSIAHQPRIPAVNCCRSK